MPLFGCCVHFFPRHREFLLQASELYYCVFWATFHDHLSWFSLGDY